MFANRTMCGHLIIRSRLSQFPSKTMFG